MPRLRQAQLRFGNGLANATICGNGLKGGHEKRAGNCVENAEGGATGIAESYRVVGSITLNRYRPIVAKGHGFSSRVNGDRQQMPSVGRNSRTLQCPGARENNICPRVTARRKNRQRDCSDFDDHDFGFPLVLAG
jgi:hypothetical protein